MENLLRMVYVSTTTTPVSDATGSVQVDVGRILMQARKNNPRDKIGGVLYFSNNYFFQCLEGEQQAVNRLYNKIMHDSRHNNVQTVSAKRIDKRLFSNWSMKYIAQENIVVRLLRSNGFSSFRPYEFDEDMIESMLSLFTEAKDISSQADQNYSQPYQQEQEKAGFLSRLLKRNKAA